MDGPKTFSQTVEHIGTMLGGLTLRQRFLLAGGAVMVGVTLWIFVGLMGKPKYVTLYSGLKPGEAQAMGSRLAAKSIAYQLSPDGTSLLVPEDKLDASRLETASQGLPRNARMGFEIFDTPNWAGSDFTEKVNYQRALEGELERTLQTLGEVEAARVHLVLPHESLYSGQESPAKAAVILKTRQGQLSEEAQLAIPQLVASAVEGLHPQEVTIVDADTNAPLMRRRNSVANPGAYDLDEELTKTLVRTLEPVVGAGHVWSSVHVEYDLSTSENTEEIYDPKATATLTQQKSEEQAGGAGPAGVPGTASNLPGNTTPSIASSSDSQSSRSESATFAVSKTVRHTMQPAGRIRRIAAAVLVDDVLEAVDNAGKKSLQRRKRTPEEMKQIELLASAAIGIDRQRGDLFSLENLSFHQEPVEPPAPPTRIEKTRKVVTEWSGVLRYVALGILFFIVYWLILRPVKKQVLTAFRELPGKIAQNAKELSAPTPSAQAAVELEMPSGSEQGRRATLLKRQLSDKIKAEPAVASRLVQSWIRESEE